MAAALPLNGELQVLDLRNNFINDIGLLALADGLRRGGRVSKVCLWGNTFGPKSAAAFADLYETSGIEFDFVPFISDEDGTQIAKA